MTINPTEISDIIKDKINKLDTKTQSHNQGTVISLTDGIATVSYTHLRAHETV